MIVEGIRTIVLAFDTLTIKLRGPIFLAHVESMHRSQRYAEVKFENPLGNGKHKTENGKFQLSTIAMF